MSAILETKPRFKGCPLVCVSANLPAFDSVEHLKAWRRQQFGEEPDRLVRVWRCRACGMIHHLTKPRPPSGSSSGTARR